MSGARITSAASLPVLIAAALLLPFSRFVPDDLFIYLQFARNLVERVEIAFNPGEPVNAVTSPLWFLLIAAAREVGLDALIAAKAASALAALLAVAGAVRLAERTSGRRDVAFLAGLLLAVDPWLLRWGASGMEGAASAAAVVWTFALRAGRPGRGAAVVAALLLALCPLLRPECVVLVAVVLAWDLVVALRERRVRALLLDGCFALLINGAWGAVALAAFGSVIPATAVAKGSLGASFFGVLASIGRVLGILATGEAAALALLALAAAAGLRGIRPGTAGRALWRTALVWCLGLLALYALRHVRVYTRYLLTLLPLVAAAGPVAVAPLLARGGSSRRLVRGVAALGVAAALGFGAGVVWPRTLAYQAHMRSVNVALARFLAETTPADSVVAVPNIGAIGYLSGRRILDLNGLVTPALVPFKREGRLEDYLRRHPPDYYIDIDPDPERALRDPPGLRLVPVRSLPFRFMFLRQSEPLWYTLYRVEGVLEPGGREGQGDPPRPVPVRAPR